MFYRVLLLTALLLLVQFGTVTRSGAEDLIDSETIVLRVGEQRSLSAREVDSYSEGTPGIADIRVTRDQTRFVIVGKQEGTTSLLLIRRDGSQRQHRIRVLSEDASKGFGTRENVRLDLYFVMIQERYGHQIGLDWPGTIGATDVPSTASLAISGGSAVPTQSSFQVLSQTFMPSLDLAQAKGWAKVYRQAALVTANGTEAVFTSGGEFNVQVQNNLTVDVKPIEFGTTVSVLPKYDPRTGRIELEIRADVSHLDAERGVEGIPGRMTSHVETLVNLELGQSVSLAGVRAQSEKRVKKGLPGLSQVPFIGALFGTHSREHEQTQAYMFVVPSVVEPVALSQRNRVEESLRVYENFRGNVDDQFLIEQPRVLGDATQARTGGER